MLSTISKLPGLLLALLLLAYAALHAAWTVFKWGGSEIIASFAGAAFILPSFAATALVFWRYQRESHPSVRRGWGLLGVAFGFYSVGQVIWTSYTLSGTGLPFPNLSDPFFLIFPWLFFASLIALTRNQLSRLDRRRVLLNTVVMVGSVGLMEWVFLLRHSVALEAARPLVSLVALLYPVGDLVMVGGLLFSSLLVLDRVRRRFLLPLVGGAALFVVGNLIYAIQSAAGSYRVGTPLDVTWTLGFVLFSVAALLPERPADVGEGAQRTPLWPKRAPEFVVSVLLLGALAALLWLVVSPRTGLADSIVVGAALLLTGTAAHLRRGVEEDENAQLNRELQELNAALGARIRVAVDDLEHRNRELEVQTRESQRSSRESQERTQEVTLLNELGDLLQMCVSFEEASSVIIRMGPHFFPNSSGALYLTSAPSTLVERSVGWGDQGGGEAFAPDDCWALRRGRDHLFVEGGTAPRCAHMRGDAVERPLGSPVGRPVGSHLCIPLMAQGEALGLICLSTPQNAPTWQSETKQRLARTFGDAVALALSNLRLRETLRIQSIRDPLTGLFNRRYLEETFEREIRRAARAETLIGVVIFNIDHFKTFNDTFGHEAGDLVLRELGPLIKERLRGDDIACRYGGEEFVLVLPGITLEATRLRAEALREAVKRLHLSPRDQPLGQFSLSLGVAVYPASGQTAESLIRIADEALYRAKREGRDRVVVAYEHQVVNGKPTKRA